MLFKPFILSAEGFLLPFLLNTVYASDNSVDNQTYPKGNINLCCSAAIDMSGLFVLRWLYYRDHEDRLETQSRFDLSQCL